VSPHAAKTSMPAPSMVPFSKVIVTSSAVPVLKVYHTSCQFWPGSAQVGLSPLPVALRLSPITAPVAQESGATTEMLAASAQRSFAGGSTGSQATAVAVIEYTPTALTVSISTGIQ